MAKRIKSEFFLDHETFEKGLYALKDTTKAPFGTAKEMKNMEITDRGGVAPRPGVELLGQSENTNGNTVRSLYNYRRSFETNELLIKSYDDELEYLSRDHESEGWQRLENGFTTDKEFGFATTLVNEDNQDYCVFCNRHEDFRSWRGSVTTLDGALSGGETTVTVDSVLADEIYFSGTATSSTTTTLDVSGTPWAADQWIGFYVLIKAGGEADKIRKITDSTNSQITFNALDSDPGNVDFEIRRLKFPATGTIIYNGTAIDYTDIDKYNEFTVSSAHAASDGDPVTESPSKHPENPRGNRFTNYLGRVIVGNVRSARARDDGGALSGYSAGGSYFVSNQSDALDFTYDASRKAGQGDVISTPYGGGEITDVSHQEDTAYVFKEQYIESVKYSQDSNDVAVRDALTQELGSIGRVIKGPNDVYFVTKDNKITSIGRVRAKDTRPQVTNIGHDIKRLLDEYEFGEGKGRVYKDRLYIPAKSDSSQNSNDIVIVYNIEEDAFEGIWDIPAYIIEEWDDRLVYSESTGANVYEMLKGKSDVIGSDRFEIVSKYQTHFMNLAETKNSMQAVSGLYFEGYIKGGSTITFKAWKNLNDSPFLEFDFSGTEEEFLEGADMDASLGGEPLALSPKGALGEEDEDGRRHFYFRVYFPFQYGRSFSVGFESSDTDIDYEVTRFGMNVKETVSVDTNRVKTV